MVEKDRSSFMGIRNILMFFSTACSQPKDAKAWGNAINV
jgi:hypothetical protein